MCPRSRRVFITLVTHRSTLATKRCLVLFAALLPLAVPGGWVDPTGRPIPDAENRRSIGAFGVHIVLAANEAQFRKTWHSSRTPPRLNAINTVRRGETVSALLIFHGCTPAATGACEVVSSFIIEGSDGGRTPGGDGPVWTEAPARPGLLQLGQAGMSVVFDPSDPVGDYRIIANIEDRVSGRVLSVWLV